MHTDSHVCFISDIAGAHWIDFEPPRKATDTKTASLEKLFTQSNEEKKPSTRDSAPEEPVNLPSDLLADKWRPRQYTQLLSDEKCNLEIMAYFEGFTRNASANPHETSEPCILVLNGPPGVGKSTLCGVIARHWDFDPVEINASRERNESQFMQTVTSVLRSSSASTKFGDSSAKNCLVVEELDGISSNGVASLLRAIVAENRSCPVVCITNDLYVPQLRNFRQHQRVRCITIPPIDESRMQQRLTAIAKAENIYSGMSPERLRSVLKHIASHACGDIRVALNLLQLAHIPKGTSPEKLKSAEIDGKSPYGIWAYILTKKRPMLHGPGKATVPVQRLLEQLNRCGNIQRIADGVFENALSSLGIGTFHFSQGKSLVHCAQLWSSVDSATEHFGGTIELLLRILILSMHLAIQRDGTYSSAREYRWPKMEYAKTIRDTQRGQFIVDFTHQYARNFSGVINAADAVMCFIPALISSAQRVDRLLNDVSGYDYTRIPSDQQEAVEHIASVLRRYSLLPPPRNVSGTGKRFEHRGDAAGYFSPRVWEALVDVADYCFIEKKGVFAHSPRKKKGGELSARRIVTRDHQTPIAQEQMSLRALMRDAPKLPVSKAAAAAEKNRTDPFAKFRVPKVKPQQEQNVGTTSLNPKRYRETPEYKVRFRPYKYSTSVVIRKALIGDFLL